MKGASLGLVICILLYVQARPRRLRRAPQLTEVACSKDGYYYNDAGSYVSCLQGKKTVQNCAPGTVNKPASTYKNKVPRKAQDFCSEFGTAKGPVADTKLTKPSPSLSQPKPPNQQVDPKIQFQAVPTHPKKWQAAPTHSWQAVPTQPVPMKEEPIQPTPWLPYPTHPKPVIEQATIPTTEKVWWVPNPTESTKKRTWWAPPTEPTTAKVWWQPPTEPTTAKVWWQPPTEPTTAKVWWQPPTEPTTAKVWWKPEPTQPTPQPTWWKQPAPPVPKADAPIPVPAAQVPTHAPLPTHPPMLGIPTHSPQVPSVPGDVVHKAPKRMAGNLGRNRGRARRIRVRTKKGRRPSPGLLRFLKRLRSRNKPLYRFGPSNAQDAGTFLDPAGRR